MTNPSNPKSKLIAHIPLYAANHKVLDLQYKLTDLDTENQELKKDYYKTEGQLAKFSEKITELEKENERLKAYSDQLLSKLAHQYVQVWKENSALKLKLAKAVEQRNAALNFDGSDPFSTRRNRYDAELSQITEVEGKDE